MAAARELFPGLSALGLTAFTPTDAPASAGTTSRSVDSRGFGWVSDGAAKEFPLVRGIAFLSARLATAGPHVLDTTYFRHHDDVRDVLFARSREANIGTPPWPETLETFGLVRRLRERFAGNVTVVCMGGDAWRGELIAGLLPDARVITVLSRADEGNSANLAHIDYWLPFGVRNDNHDIAVVETASEFDFARGRAGAVCLFDSGPVALAGIALCAEDGLLFVRASGVPENGRVGVVALDGIEEMSVSAPKDADLTRARLLMPPLNETDLNRARVNKLDGSEEPLSTAEAEVLYFGARGYSLAEMARWTSRDAEVLSATAARLAARELCAVVTGSGALARYHRYLCSGELHPPPEQCTLPLVWRRAVERFPDRCALELLDGTEVTYRQMDGLVDRARKAMRRLGLSKGDRVGIWSGPCLEAFVLFWAATAEGCIWTLLDPLAPPPPIAERVAKLSLKHVYVERALGEGVSFESPATIFDPTTTANETGLVELDAPLVPDKASNEDDHLSNPSVGPFDPAFIASTSGTTAGSKSVQLSHIALVRHVGEQARDRMDAGWQEIRAYALRAGVTGDSIARHVIGTVYLGATHILAYRPGSVTFFETWKRVDLTRASYFSGSQAFTRQLRAALDLKDFPIPKNLRHIHTGGPIPAALRDKVAEYGNWRVGYGYSLTEMGCNCHTMRHVSTSVGANMLGSPNNAIVQIRSADGDLMVDGPGEIWIANDRGYDGYITPEGLDRSAKKGVWHHTGDIGRWDAEGNLYILGRSDDMINIETGRMIAPTAIEEMLQEDDRVVATAILPCRDRFGGTQLYAFVAAPGVDDERALRDDLAEQLRIRAGGEFIPYRWAFVEQLPATPHGKVDRRALAASIPDRLKRD